VTGIAASVVDFPLPVVPVTRTRPRGSRATCSKKSTGPDDNKPPIDSTLSVSYSADEARSVQQHISAQSGGSVKRIHAGMAVVGGIRAAALAEAGLTGPAMILEGKKGFWHAFCVSLRKFVRLLPLTGV
jgi:hypothetical protein